MTYVCFGRKNRGFPPPTAKVRLIAATKSRVGACSCAYGSESQIGLSEPSQAGHSRRTYKFLIELAEVSGPLSPSPSTRDRRVQFRHNPLPRINTFIAEFRALDLGGIDHACEHNSCRALHVIVVDAVFVPAALQQMNGSSRIARSILAIKRWRCGPLWPRRNGPFPTATNIRSLPRGSRGMAAPRSHRNHFQSPRDRFPRSSRRGRCDPPHPRGLPPL
jgi:hypothetical protein